MDTSARERGPAEEVIAKRLRPLNKKIQRFRNYKTQPEESLNADQHAALASLPQLEAVVHELEEVQKQMEEVELVAAARARELRETSEKDLNDRFTARLREHALQTAANVTGFLGLHALLHPARPNDHTNLTFAPLTLPIRLQDEVLATDILRVGRMYDDLVAGGDAAHTLLEKLAAGPRGDDEEDDHVHHLLVLLSDTATPIGNGDAEGDDLEVGSTAAEPAMSMRDDVSSAPDGGISASSSEDFDPQRTPVMSSHELSSFSDGPVASFPRGAALNFLQEDELATAEAAAAQRTPQVVVNVALEQEYEVIEPMSAVMSEAAETLSPPETPLDWTASDENETTTDPDADVDADVSDVVQQVSDALNLTNMTEAAPATPDSIAADATTPGSKREGAHQRKRRPQRKDGVDNKEPRESKEKQSKDGSDREAQPRRRQQQGPRGDKQQHGQAAASSAAAVDSDGFEVKTSRRASNAGRGRSAGRGRGGGSRVGAGGAPREARTGGKENGSGAPSTPKDATSTPRKPAANANGKRGEGNQETPKARPSIYKTTQPSAPASAPIF